jgi:hypothetical protein
MGIGEIDHGLVVRSVSDPPYCKCSHKTGVRIGCDEVVAISAIASHGTNSLHLECMADFLDQVCANQVGKVLDDLDELCTDELAPVRVI